MGIPPVTGGPAFRFTATEVAEMEAILKEHDNAMPAHEILVGLADKFSGSTGRKGRITIQTKQVWNWFQNRRYAIRAKLSRNPGNLSLSAMPGDDPTPVWTVPQPATVPMPQPTKAKLSKNPAKLSVSPMPQDDPTSVGTVPQPITMPALSGMDPIYVLVEYNGWWKRVDTGLWEWCGSGLTGGFVVDRGIKFLELVEMIYQKTSINQNDYAIEITHKPVGDKHVKTAPILISSDSEFKDLMFWYKSEDSITIHATLKENREGKWEIGMDPIYVLLEYNGRWKQLDSGFWEWRGSDLAKAFVVDRSIKFRKLVEIIYHKASINRSVYVVEIKHKPVGDKHVKTAPTLISDDLDFTDLMFWYKNEDSITLHVTLKENREKGKGKCNRDKCRTCGQTKAKFNKMS